MWTAASLSVLMRNQGKSNVGHTFHYRIFFTTFKNIHLFFPVSLSLRHPQVCPFSFTPSLPCLPRLPSELTSLYFWTKWEQEKSR